MKSKQVLLSMLYARLGELQNGRVKKNNPALAEKLRIELALLYDIIDEDVPEEFWDEIEKEIDE